MNTNKASAPPSSLLMTAPLPETLPLSAQERERLMSVIGEANSIRRHYHLFRWLRGGVQEFLPHEILVSAWGDFSTWNLKLDVASALPGVRTEQLEYCSIDDLLKALHEHWVSEDRKPLVVEADKFSALVGSCKCALHRRLREMDSLLVHGVHDARGGQDSLYLAFARGYSAQSGASDRLALLADGVISQIDSAYRRVPAFPLSSDGGSPHSDAALMELSAREQQVLEWICRGKSNLDIARTLSISPFTVKNHLQRIFRKIGVANRTEAATKYTRALSELSELLKD